MICYLPEGHMIDRIYFTKRTQMIDCHVASYLGKGYRYMYIDDIAHP